MQLDRPPEGARTLLRPVAIFAVIDPKSVAAGRGELRGIRTLVVFADRPTRRASKTMSREGASPVLYPATDSRKVAGSCPCGQPPSLRPVRARLPAHAPADSLSPCGQFTHGCQLLLRRAPHSGVQTPGKPPAPVRARGKKCIPRFLCLRSVPCFLLKGSAEAGLVAQIRSGAPAGTWTVISILRKAYHWHQHAHIDLRQHFCNNLDLFNIFITN